MKQVSMDFNKRQYMRPVDFELFYYNDTELRSVFFPGRKRTISYWRPDLSSFLRRLSSDPAGNSSFSGVSLL